MKEICASPQASASIPHCNVFDLSGEASPGYGPVVQVDVVSPRRVVVLQRVVCAVGVKVEAEGVLWIASVSVLLQEAGDLGVVHSGVKVI